MQLELIGHSAGLNPDGAPETDPQRLQAPLFHLHRTTGQRVVVFVDGYDRPTLDALGEPPLAKANRQYLRGLYGIIKDSAEHVHFVLVTGVAQFFGNYIHC